MSGEHLAVLAGRTAIVTGASKGLGRAHARLLAARGCAVVVSNGRGVLAGAASDFGPDVERG